MKRFALLLSLLVTAAATAGPVAPDGTEVDCDLPVALHLRNRGGSDGAGLCVFASMSHAGRWHTEPVFTAAFEHMFRYPGGGYPSKVDAVVKRIATEKNLPVPAYLQVESGDLDLLADAVQRGHLIGVTYSWSPTGRYGGRQIAHMVNCVAARAGPAKLWAVLDNNYPGDVEWMDEKNFARSYTGIGGGWSVILLLPPPPPVVRNRG
jgi:hypothetical protein